MHDYSFSFTAILFPSGESGQNFRVTGYNFPVIFPPVREKAVRAVLDAILPVAEISATPVTKEIKGTVAEQTVEVLRIRSGMTGKVFAFPVAEESIMPALPVPVHRAAS
jgi:hypothetical protein